MASEDRNAAQNPLDEVSVPHPMSKKWIPFTHMNGLAIYYHQNVVDSHDFVGGEYMVSSIVKGSPEQCLAALTHRWDLLSSMPVCSNLNISKHPCSSQHLSRAYSQGVTASLRGNTAASSCTSWRLCFTFRSSTTTILGPATAVDVLGNHGNTQVSWELRDIRRSHTKAVIMNTLSHHTKHA